MRLTDADALYEKTANWEAQALHMVKVTMYDEDKTEWRKWSTILTERSAFKYDIADAPTIDAVEVVRCEECRYGITEHGISNGWVLCSKPYTERGNAMHRTDWFCADGERKEQNDE